MFDYIKEYYKLPFLKKGMKVEYEGKKGIITGARGQYLLIKEEGNKHSDPYHPTYHLKYFDSEGKEIHYEA